MLQIMHLLFASAKMHFMLHGRPRVINGHSCEKLSEILHEFSRPLIVTATLLNHMQVELRIFTHTVEAARWLLVP